MPVYFHLVPKMPEQLEIEANEQLAAQLWAALPLLTQRLQHLLARFLIRLQYSSEHNNPLQLMLPFHFTFQKRSSPTGIKMQKNISYSTVLHHTVQVPTFR